MSLHPLKVQGTNKIIHNFSSCISSQQKQILHWICREPNFKLSRNIHESDACIKFKQNPLRKKKVIACQRRKPYFHLLENIDESFMHAI